MAQYRVVLTGFQDSSMDGMAHFFTKFGQAYNKTPKEARTWLEQAKNVLYRFDDPEQAEKARAYIEGLGGVAQVEEAPPEPITPKAPPPAPPPPAAPDYGKDARATFPGTGWAPAPLPGAASPGAGPGDWANQYGGQPMPYQPYQPPPPKNYMHLYDLGTIFSSTFELFIQNLKPLFMINLLQIVVIGIISLLQTAMRLGQMFMNKFDPQMMTGGLISLIILVVLMLPVVVYIILFCQTASVIALADAINGRTPDYKDCLRRVDYYLPIKLLATEIAPGLLQLLCLAPAGVLIGFAIYKEDTALGVMGGTLGVLMIPLLFYLWTLFMFIQPIVVLEGPWMVDALQRSADLSRGYRLRNLGITLLMGLMISLAVGLVSCFAQCIPFAGAAVQVLGRVLMTVPVLLLYYDLRLREEAGPDAYSGPVGP